MKILLFFVLLTAVLVGWRYVPQDRRTQVWHHIRRNLLLVLLAAGITLALLVFALFTQGKIL